MRKSLENVVSGSHDAIGSSISQALAFTNAMTLPANNQDNIPTTETQQIQQNVLSTPQNELQTQRSHSPTNKSVQSKLSSPSTNSMPEQDSTANVKANNESPKSLLVNRSTSQKSPKSGSSGGSASPNEKKETTNGEKSEKNDSKGDKEKKKKKSSWLNVLYPTYKSRSEDFKRLFKDVPDDERLVVDYSCALQKEILVHGRMFVSQNFLCFHASIFGWETTVCLQWKDVTSITKEKTALVIPNAILVCTQTDKMFFTSFGTRDKAYLMLFRVWQNALMGKQMGQQEMWQWVHFCYGDELGLTSDDEDYIPPNNEDDKLTVGQRLSVESIIEDPVTPTSVPDGISLHEIGLDDKKIIITPRKKKKSTSRASPTDSSETDGEKKIPQIKEPTPPSPISSYRKEIKPKLIIPVCISSHEGRSIANITIPMHVDTLFTMLFTDNKFLMDFHEARRTTDYLATPWTESANGEKTRTVTLTVALNASVGPKVSNVTETQILSSVTAPGLYAIDVESVNANIPYADSFYVLTHYCLSYVNERESRLQIYAQIKYRKSIWGLVKGMIEKNCWAGMEDFFQSLTKALIRHNEEIVEPKVPSKRKAPRPPRKRTASTQPVEFIEVPQGTIIATSGNILETQPTATIMNNKNSTIHFYSTWFIVGIVLFLLLVNAMLYVKLVALEDEAKLSNSQIDFNYFKEPPTSYNEWIEIFYTQEKIHLKETNKYKRVLRHTIELLKKAEDALVKLQLDLSSDPNSAFSHIATVISSLEDTVSNSKNNNNEDNF
ncbi:protein Aster-B-like isoform X2 [Chrysoperla carnea]|nr:protein Aster-B-like isoform X2 [Chrysoperla carnea]